MTHKNVTHRHIEDETILWFTCWFNLSVHGITERATSRTLTGYKGLIG